MDKGKAIELAKAYKKVVSEKMSLEARGPIRLTVTLMLLSSSRNWMMTSLPILRCYGGCVGK